MTLRTRLALAFFGLLVGPALLATVLFARALPMPAPLIPEDPLSKLGICR